MVDSNDGDLHVDLLRKKAEVPLLIRPSGIWLHNIVTDHPSYAGAALECFPCRKFTCDDGAEAVIAEVELL